MFKWGDGSGTAEPVLAADGVEDPEQPIVARRVDLPCEMVGFATPPTRVQLTFLPVGERWTLVALTAPGKAAQVARWLQAYAPSRINVAPGLAPKIVRASFDALPAPWSQMLSAVLVIYTEITAEGAASIFIEDSEARVERFVESVQVDAQVRQRVIQGGAVRVKLTARQLDVLCLAVALGYYETPHKLNLRFLAEKLGVGVSAVSELLRRGESLIITSYVDSLSRSEWDAIAQQRTVIE